MTKRPRLSSSLGDFALLCEPIYREISTFLPLSDLISWRCASLYFSEQFYPIILSRRRRAFLGDLPSLKSAIDLDPDLALWTLEDGTRPIHIACEQGDLGKLRLMIHSTRFRYRNLRVMKRADGSTPLRIAAAQEHNQVIALLEHSLTMSSLLKTPNQAWTTLHRAALLGDLAGATRALTQEHIDPNAKDDDGWTPLHASLVARCNLDVIQLLLQHGADPSKLDPWGRSPLHYACAVWNTDAAQLLLQGGARVNLKDPFRGATPLLEACCQGPVRLVQMLLSQGADSTILDRLQHDVFSYAVAGGNVPMLRYLRTLPGISLQPNRGLHPAVHFACLGGSLDTLRYLHEELGLSLQERNMLGCTPLHPACASGRIEVLSYLLQRGLDPNAQSREGEVPLSSALSCGSLEVIQLLVSYGASPCIQDARFLSKLARSPVAILQYLHSLGAPLSSHHIIDACSSTLQNVLYFLHKGVPLEPLAIMLSKAAQSGSLDVISHLGKVGGADMNGMDAEGYVPLQHSCRKGYYGITKYLLEHGANPDKPHPNDGLTPVHLACASGDLRILHCLAQHGARLDVLTALGESPVHYARSLNVLRYLSEDCGLRLDVTDQVGRLAFHTLCESDRDTELACFPYLAEHAPCARDLMSQFDDSGATPLHAAAEQGRIDIVEFLLNRGVPIDAHTEEGDTPLMVAGTDQIALLLLNRGADPNLGVASWTPIHSAVASGDVERAKLLVEHGAQADDLTEKDIHPKLRNEACVRYLRELGILKAS